MNAEKMKLLSRKHIQAIAINHGIKGNMKSEDIIQILVKRYPDGVPLHNLPVSSQNITASSRTVVMQWSDAQGRYIEVPVGNRQDQPPPIAGPSQPPSHYRSLGVFGAVPTVDYATGQRPAAPGGSSSIPHNLQTASSNSYKHYRNVAPEFLPGPQMYSASAGSQARPGQTNGGASHPGTRPHAQHTPYAAPAPSPVWRAPAPPTDTESTTRQRSAAQTREPTPLIDDSYDTGPAPADPSPVDVSHEVQASALSRAPSPSTRPRDAQDSAPEAAHSNLATDSDMHDAVRKMANIAKFQQQCRKSLERMSEITSTSGIICSDLEAVVQQECFHFQRMTTYVDHVNPELAPRWRDEVIWDKACPTFVDDDDNLLEYDTDDEKAPTSPAPTMVKWHRRAQPQEPPSADADAAGDQGSSVPAGVPLVTESASAPASPKRKQVDEDDQAPRAKKRVRRSRATVGVVGTPVPSRLTRSAARKKNAEGRTMTGIDEEEEEQDMISVLSILTQPADDTD